MTREEVLSIEESCGEHEILHKKCLEDLEYRSGTATRQNRSIENALFPDEIQSPIQISGFLRCFSDDMKIGESSRSHSRFRSRKQPIC